MGWLEEGLTVIHNVCQRPLGSLWAAWRQASLTVTLAIRLQEKSSSDSHLHWIIGPKSILHLCIFKKLMLGPGLVVHACNPSYTAGEAKEDLSWRQALSKKWEAIS
jgi:hypothetical protein